MQQRESLLGAQTGKSVFRLIHLVKINLEPAMTRTVASQDRNGANRKLAASQIRTNRAADDCSGGKNKCQCRNGLSGANKTARLAIEFTKINAADTADACFVFAQLEKSKRGCEKNSSSGAGQIGKKPDA